jgi:hypothetical protein
MVHQKMTGIYVLVKEVVDNCIDEHMMGYGKIIDIKITEQRVVVRDYGRGDSAREGCRRGVEDKYREPSMTLEPFQKSVGLNGVGTKAVNAVVELILRFRHSAMDSTKLQNSKRVCCSMIPALAKAMRRMVRWWSLNRITPCSSTITSFPNT